VPAAVVDCSPALSAQSSNKPTTGAMVASGRQATAVADCFAKKVTCAYGSVSKGSSSENIPNAVPTASLHGPSADKPMCFWEDVKMAGEKADEISGKNRPRESCVGAAAVA